MPRPLKDAPLARAASLRMQGDVRSPEGWKDGTLCAAETELAGDGRADSVRLRVTHAGSQQQQRC